MIVIVYFGEKIIKYILYIYRFDRLNMEYFNAVVRKFYACMKSKREKTLRPQVIPLDLDQEAQKIVIFACVIGSSHLIAFLTSVELIRTLNHTGSIFHPYTL